MMNNQPENMNTMLFNDRQHKYDDHHFVGPQHYQQDHGDRPRDISNNEPVNVQVHKGDNGQSVPSPQYNELPIEDVEVTDTERWIDTRYLFTGQFNEQPDQEFSNNVLDDLKFGDEYFADQENQNFINPPAANNINGPMQQHQVHMQFNIKQEDPVQCVNQLDNMQSGILSNQTPQQVNNQQFALQDSQFNSGQVVQRIGNTNMQQVIKPNLNRQFALQDGQFNNGQVVQRISNTNMQKGAEPTVNEQFTLPGGQFNNGQVIQRTGDANMQKIAKPNLNRQFALQDGQCNNGQVVQQMGNTNMQHLTYNMPNLNSNTQGFAVPYLNANKEQFSAQNGYTNARQFGAQNGYTNAQQFGAQNGNFNIPQSAVQNGTSTNIPNETMCIKQEDGSLLLLPPAGTPYNQLQQSVSQTGNKRGRKRKAVKELKPPKPRCMIPTFKKNMLKTADMPENYNREIKTQIVTAKEFLENKKPEPSKEKETESCETKSDIMHTDMLHAVNPSDCQAEHEKQVLRATERENKPDYSDATGQSPRPSLADETIPTETYLPAPETANKPTQENSVKPASSNANEPGLSKSFAQADTNKAALIVQTGKDLEPTRTEQNCNKTAIKPTQENSVMPASSDANEPGLSKSFAQADANKEAMTVQTGKDVEPTRTEQNKKWPCEKGNCKKKGRVFDSEDALKAHNAIHNRTPKHPCPHCSYSGHMKWHLDNHMIKEHRDLESELDEQLKCTFGNCPKIFPTEALLKQHCSISHKSEFKNESKRKSESATATKPDIQASGNEEQKVKTKPGKGTTIQCELCDHKPTFAKKAYLLSHMFLHKKEPSFECKYCSKSFWHKSSFNSHFCNNMPPEKRNKKRKPKREKKTYECTKCGRHFSSYTNHKHHMLAHDGKFQYKCSVCEKEFNNQIHYESHMDRHYKVKRFKCEYCERRTVSKADMKQHMRQHTGVKPFKCKYCDKLFTHNSNRNTHEKTHNKKHVKQKQQQVEHEEQQIMDHKQNLQSDLPEINEKQEQQPELLQISQQQNHEQQLPQQQLRMMEGGLRRFVPENMQSGQDQWTVQRQHEIAKIQREQCIALRQPMVQTHQHHVEHQQTHQLNNQLLSEIHVKQEQVQMHKPQQLEQQEHTSFMQLLFDEQSLPEMYGKPQPQPEQLQMHQQRQEHNNILPTQQDHHHHVEHKQTLQSNNQLLPAIHVKQAQQPEQLQMHQQQQEHNNIRITQQGHHHHVEHQQTLQSNNPLLPAIHVIQKQQPEQLQMHQQQQEHNNIRPTQQGHHHHPVEHQQTLQSNNPLLPAIHVKQAQQPE